MTDLAQTAILRSDAYRLLAACFYEPEREMFLEEKLCANLGELFAKFSMPLNEICQRMQQGLEAKNQDELLLEYTTLFLGPFTIPAQPFGSVYLDKDKCLMGDSTMEARNLYAEAGVKHEDEGPPDHIAIELEFMSFLEQRIAQALSEANQADLADYSAIRARFFHGLLAPWVPQLGKAMVDNSEEGFYRALGECLIGFIAAEKANIPPQEAAEAK